MRAGAAAAGVGAALTGGAETGINLGTQTGDPALGMFTSANFPGSSATDRSAAAALYGVMDILCYPRQRCRLTELTTPLIALIVSGGHTMIALVPERGRYEILGQTIDDAAGEAFDKIARYIGLGFPGGPEIDRLAAQGNASAYKFPRAKMKDDDYDFSYSGLKTAVIRWIRERQDAGEDINAADLAASFQEAIVDVQVAKTLRAAEERGVKTVVIAGGVAANSRLRERMRSDGEKRGIDVVSPSLLLCTDNGAMIAALGAHVLHSGAKPSPLDMPANPGLPVHTIVVN